MGFIDNYKYQQSVRPKAGIQRCVVISAQQGLNSKGKQMITLVVRVSGSETQVKTWMTEGEYFNKNASEFFDAFPEVGEGNFDLDTWVGCEGAGDFKFDERGYLTLKWFVSPDRAKDLPPYSGKKPQRVEKMELDETAGQNADDFPF